MNYINLKENKSGLYDCKVYFVFVDNEVFYLSFDKFKSQQITKKLYKKGAKVYSKKMYATRFSLQQLCNLFRINFANE